MLRLGSFIRANHLALVALFVALGGTAYSASQLPRNSVGTKQLKRNAVVSVKVKDRSLLARDFKRGQIPIGAQGPTGPAGGQGPTGAQGAKGPKGDPAYTQTAVVSPTGTALENGTALRQAVAAVPPFLDAYKVELEPGIYDIGSTTLALTPNTLLEGARTGATIIEAQVSGTGGAIAAGQFASLRSLTLTNAPPAPGNADAVGVAVGKVSDFVIENVHVSVTAVNPTAVSVQDSLRTAILSSRLEAGGPNGKALVGSSTGPTTQLVVRGTTLTGGSGVNGYGLLVVGMAASAKVDRSVVTGALAAIAQSNAVIKIGASQVVGTVGTSGGGSVKCVYAYGAAYNMLGAACA